jgi:hypothetical protein
MDVAKVDRGMLHMLHMLQAFVQNILFVSKRTLQSFFYLDVVYVFTYMLQ